MYANGRARPFQSMEKEIMAVVLVIVRRADAAGDF